MTPEEQQERLAVITWLRRRDQHVGYGGEVYPEDYAWTLADRIERGEHRA